MDRLAFGHHRWFVFTVRLSLCCLISWLNPNAHSYAQEVRCSSPTEDAADRSWIYAPLNPHDFTGAFHQARPWVLSVAAGEVNLVEKPNKAAKKTFSAKSEGSAILWGDQKYILTNAHVIKNFPELRARTYHQRVLRLDVVAIYEPLDIAVLKTRTPHALDDLPSACYYEVLPPIGSWVAAVGHPYSMPYSLSTGVVSAHNRGELLSEWAHYYPGFIQTNITLNPGNSGGPLIDQRGVMVGMNTAVRQGAVGMSLSLPLSRIIPVMNQLTHHRAFKRSFVGLTLSHVSYQRSKAAGLDRPRGVRVKRIKEGGPATLAGLKRNDLILKVNGKPFDHPSELSWYLISSIPNVPLYIEYLRVESEVSRGFTMITPRSSSR